LAPHVERLDLLYMLDNTVLFESYQKGIEDKDALVRRSSMNCLLALYKTLGEDFEKYTSRLNENQFRMSGKLVQKSLEIQRKMFVTH